MKFTAAASMAAAGLALAACSAPLVVTDEPTVGAETLFSSAAAGRDMRAVVVGNPFNVPQSVTDAGVVSALQGSFRGIPTNITTSATTNTRPQARLIVALDHAPGVNPASLCAAANPEGMSSIAPNAPRMSAILAFCEGPALYAASHGQVGRPTSPDDPRFATLLRQMAFVLIPHDADQFGIDR